MRITKHSSRFIEEFYGKGYPYYRLREIARVVTGSTPARSVADYWTNGTHPWVSAQDMGSKYVDRTVESITDSGLATCKLIPAGSVLYVCRGSIGVMSINRIDCATNQSICSAICDERMCKSEYLFYWLLYHKDEIASLGEGTSFKSLSQKTFANLEIQLPPIEDQESFITIAQQADKSKFNDFKSRFIVWSSEWNIHMTIRDLVDISVEKAGRRFKPQDTIRYIDISSVDGESNSVIGTTEYKFSEAPSRAQQCTKKGDILVSTVRPNLKNIAVNQLGDDNLVASTGFCVLRPKEKCSGLILAYVLSEPFTQKMVAEAKGSNYPAIHDSDILDYPITVPESNEMARVGAFVQQTDKSKYLS